MFDVPLTIKTSEGDKAMKPFEMLQPIKKSKYPAITEVRNILCSMTIYKIICFLNTFIPLI